MGCGTCHNPHSDKAVVGAPADGNYLRFSNLKRELCLSCHSEGMGRAASVTISVPPVGVVVYDDHVPLIGKAEGLEKGHLTLTINAAAFPLPVKEGIIHTKLRLREGMNRIVIAGAEGALWEGEVFQGDTESVNDDYERVFRYHRTDSLEGCLSCHEGRRGEFRSETALAADLCHRCHDPVNEKRFLHGPLAVGDCMSCHDPHGGIGRYHLKDQEVSLCLSCHDTQSVETHSEWAVNQDGKSCSDCHNPHQSDTRYFTSK